MDANQLRAAFTGYFAEREHEVVPSASLIPHDPSVLFTIAGMVPFKPYFLGDERAPWPRATSVQRCFRTLDIDIVGTTSRHCTFFEMLGNFSFGDYFKTEAIPYAWELLTEVFGIDGDRLWMTVHESDDEAEQIWIDSVGIRPERIQRMGEDNWWGMGETGPCGPCSELYFDKGENYGAPGGPAFGGSERFVEIWNLVFMQFNRSADGALADLPRKSIDTGAGLERILPILEGTDSIYATDVFAPMIERAQSMTGVRYGAHEKSDVSLRILADHGRAMTVLVSDGVLPSNEGRGYVLRRIIRRAVLAARRLGLEGAVTTSLTDAAVEVLGAAYPKLAEDHDLIDSVVAREEAGFDRTLKAGLTLLEGELAGDHGSTAVLDGEVAFKLHDTHGFPIELTEELAGEAGLTVDRAAFDAAMAEQRTRARQAARTEAAADEEAYRAVLEQSGPTTFVGQLEENYSTPTQILSVLAGAEPGTAEIFMDRTPFYAEGGGQQGDIGTIVTETGSAEVYDTVSALPGLSAHRVRISGEILAGQDALATVDGERREALRRNHTGTHLLHWALRQVLGDHVRQQGSLVAPDRLRFDFSHHAAPTKKELAQVFALANAAVLADDPVTTTEATRAEAEKMGAIAFFGDKYGDTVRVVQAGPDSLEFCGGTHVKSLGQIGTITLISEGSIGSNTRRLEAVTGFVSIDRALQHDELIASTAELLKTEPETVIDAVERLLERQRNSEKELQRLHSAALESDATELAEQVSNEFVVARRDALTADDLRALAQAVRRRDGVETVVIGGSPDGKKVAIAVVTGGQPNAGELVKQVATVVGGGGGGSADVAVAGGKDPSRLDEALELARSILAGT
jgi:alanyl-tRNA synthetase